MELVYLNPTNSLPTDLSQDPAYQMLQPVWLFSGHIGEQLQFRVLSSGCQITFQASETGVLQVQYIRRTPFFLLGSRTYF